MSHRHPKKKLTQSDRLDSLRASVDERINALCQDRNEWVNICRSTLLEMEKRNIQRRAKHWTELVNEKVKDTNSRLSLNSATFENVTQKFEYAIDNVSMDKHLGFIISWKGLKTRQIQNAPKTYLEFENKAKNWLNGRRAPNYAATLFPAMIKASEIYADYISRQIFANNGKHSKLYCRICIIGFLSALCSARISLNDASKKAYLICENSVKTGKTAVSQILQRYASDHPYQDKFPSHLREASDYFENKYMELISDFAIELNQKQRKEKLNCAKNIGGHVLDIINNVDNESINNTDTASIHSNNSGLPSSITHSIMKDITNCDGNLNAISMSIDQFNKLAQFLSGMITNQKTQQNTINDLVHRVQHLESQQKKILSDVTSNTTCMNHMTKSNYNNNNYGQHIRVSPSSQTTKTTDSTPSIPPQQCHVHHVPQMNHISNITHFPPQITNINMNRGNIHNHNMRNMNALPTTSLYGAALYDSNDGDANMFGFGNQSFNSSDAGMNGIMSIPNSQFDGFNHSDQSMTLQHPTPTITNIMHYNQ